MVATPPATPPLLTTYQEARLLWDAKNWKLTGVADELREKPELKRFNISPATLSKKTTSESPSPIEPEMAAAVEALETRPGHERLVDIVMRGLRALHGAAPGEDGGTQGENGAAPGENVAKVLKELRDALPGELVEALEAKTSARDGKLVEKLEEKARAREGRLLQAVAKLGHLTWGHVAVAAAGVGALVVAVSLAPLLVRAATPPAQHIFIVARAGGGPALWAEAESYLVLSEWGEKRPLDQEVPTQTLPHQKVAPCDEGLGEVAINGNCWGAMADLKPPCGRIFRRGEKCYRPIAADPKKPVEPGEDH